MKKTKGIFPIKNVWSDFNVGDTVKRQNSEMDYTIIQTIEAIHDNYMVFETGYWLSRGLVQSRRVTLTKIS